MKTLRNAAIGILFFNSISALFGGYKLMMEPSGGSLKMSFDLLKNSPFTDFFYPGLILFVIIGVISFIGCLLLIAKRNSAYTLVLFQGVALGGWIIVEIAMIRELQFFQGLFVSLALILLFIGSRMRAHIVNDPI